MSAQAKKVKVTESNIIHCSVVDNVPPEIHDCPVSFTIYATPNPTKECAVAYWTVPTATDNKRLVNFYSDYQPGFCFPVGVTKVTYIAEDEGNNTTAVSFDVTVISSKNTPLIVTTTPNFISEKNHKLVDINTFVSLNGKEATNFTLESITCNESDHYSDDSADLPNDVQGADFGKQDNSFKLRAECHNNLVDRVYTITYGILDQNNKVTKVTGYVTVSHN